MSLFGNGYSGIIIKLQLFFFLSFFSSVFFYLMITSILAAGSICFTVSSFFIGQMSEQILTNLGIVTVKKDDYDIVKLILFKKM